MSFYCLGDCKCHLVCDCLLTLLRVLSTKNVSSFDIVKLNILFYGGGGRMYVCSVRNIFLI